MLYKSDVTRCCLFFGVVLILVANPTWSQHTIPIEFELDLSAIPDDHWLQADRDRVRQRLESEFEQQLNVDQRHWEISCQLDSVSGAILAVETVHLPSDAIAVTLELRLQRHGPTPRWEEFEICQSELYKPLHFETFGRPSPDKALQDLLDVVRQMLTTFRIRTQETLLKNVPIARNPTTIDPTETTIIAPLPKQRFGYLAWSKFRVWCLQSPTSFLATEGRNEWGQYDATIPSALKLFIVDGVSNPTAMTPALVFLEEEISDPWFTFYVAGGVR